MVEHVVLMKFRPEISSDTIRNLFIELASLQRYIPGITRFSWGPYSSPEGLNKGFTHGFLMEFDCPASRDRYLTHPEHERVKAGILPHLADLIVFDFEV